MAVFGTDRIELKQVPGYGGKYYVGTDGSVWRDGSALIPVRGLYVNLSWQSHVETVKVAYLVARAFVPNMEMRPFVRHVDGNIRNNRASNLEWSEEKEDGRSRKGVGEPVSVWSRKTGELVGSWGSLKEACRALGVEMAAARRMMRGGVKSTKGYIFK